MDFDSLINEPIIEQDELEDDLSEEFPENPDPIYRDPPTLP